jgi:hypothetical protein
MAAQPRDDLARVGCERRDELRVVRGHALEAGARLRELLPDEQAEAVAQRVELLALDQPAAPDAQQVDVRALRETSTRSSFSGLGTPWRTSSGTQFQPLIGIGTPLTERR